MKNVSISLLIVILIASMSCEKEKDVVDDVPEMPDSLLNVNINSLLDISYTTIRV